MRFLVVISVFWGDFAFFGVFSRYAAIISRAARKKIGFSPPRGREQNVKFPLWFVAASLRHVRRLESARSTPQKTPPGAIGAHAKRAVSRARSAANYCCYRLRHRDRNNNRAKLVQAKWVKPKWVKAKWVKPKWVKPKWVKPKWVR